MAPADPKQTLGTSAVPWVLETGCRRVVMKRNALALALLLVSTACTIQDGAEVTMPCTEPERVEYAATVLGHVVQNWNQPRSLAGVTCVLRVI